MSSWLCILNGKNFEIVKKYNIWGVSYRHKNRLFSTRPGEKCAFYLTVERSAKNRKDSAIGGIFEIISNPYEDHSEIFPSSHTLVEMYEYRVRLKVIKILNPECPFKPLIPSLTFITNKKNYGSHLVGKAMIKIPEEDMKLILNYSHPSPP